MLGTMFTPDRDRAKLYGFCVHLVNGWLFVVRSTWPRSTRWRRATWWLGGADRRSCTRCSCSPSACAVLPGLHPRMASEQHGPDGRRGSSSRPDFSRSITACATPLVVLVAHVLYGTILGCFG